MRHIALLYPPITGGVKTLTSRLYEGLKLEGFHVNLLPLSNKHIISAFAKDYTMLKQLTKYDFILYLGSIAFRSLRKMYVKYLEGNLQKVLSCGSETRDFLKNAFRGIPRKDIIYISANPYINSKGIYFGEFDSKSILNFTKILGCLGLGFE